MKIIIPTLHYEFTKFLNLFELILLVLNLLCPKTFVTVIFIYGNIMSWNTMLSLSTSYYILLLKSSISILSSRVSIFREPFARLSTPSQNGARWRYVPPASDYTIMWLRRPTARSVVSWADLAEKAEVLFTICLHLLEGTESFRFHPICPSHASGWSILERCGWSFHSSWAGLQPPFIV